MKPQVRPFVGLFKSLSATCPWSMHVATWCLNDALCTESVHFYQFNTNPWEAEGLGGVSLRVLKTELFSTHARPVLFAALSYAGFEVFLKPSIAR